MSKSKNPSPLLEAIKALIPMAVQELVEAIPRWIQRRKERREAKEAQEEESFEYPTTSTGQGKPDKQ